MMIIDWGAVLTGFAAGVLASFFYFYGLAWGLQRAIQARHPEIWLLLSSACRMTIFLLIGFKLTTVGDNSWPLAGYALAFFLVRWAAVTRAKVNRVFALPKEGGA